MLSFLIPLLQCAHTKHCRLIFLSSNAIVLTLEKDKMVQRQSQCLVQRSSSPPLSGIMAALGALVKPKIIKKRTKKFIWHQTDKSKSTGRNPKVLTTGVEEIQGPDPDAQHWLLKQQKKKQTTRCPGASGSSGAQREGAGNAANGKLCLGMLRSSQRLLRKPQGQSGKRSPAWPSESPIPTPGCSSEENE
ncbi:hypothetical protein TREES_T100000103 [Tupaia chinensis]|uniref:Uncharacterized protein n=1 Tax=Tupaia chinensis TaxID=246437 RepID=L9LAP5_TUPCH|nr:hypothetical protein TREES_T100000103 [Tupaia chinensis]